jgi:N-acetylglucosaminyl-diphospho-decaprenol L-rhamnosyltransferase
MSAPSLDIVIVNWNAGELLYRCLSALPAALDGSLTLSRVVVVDNASSDGSLDRLSTLPLPLTIVRNTTNRGFGAACNQGSQGSSADYLLFLNPDVYVGRDSLSVPIAFLSEPAHADVGAAGIQLRDARGTISRSSARVPTPGTIAARILGLDVLFPGRVPSLFLTTWDHASTRELEHVIGAFYVIRRPLFEELGGFDERFFVYLEDLDLSVRVRQHGWRIYYLADAHAEHTGGGTSDAIKARRIAYSLHSRIQYGFKHFGPAAGLLLALGTLVVEPGPRLGRALARRSVSEVRDTCLGFAHLWGRVFRGLIAARSRGHQ